MPSAVHVRNLSIGEGLPKICIPLLGTTEDALLREAGAVKALAPDLVEWRADYFTGLCCHHSVTAALRALRVLLADTPLLFTVRTKREHGEAAPDDALYCEIITHAAESGLVDLVDVELFTPAAPRTALLAALRNSGVKCILSNHDFDATPPKKILLDRLAEMEALGADIAKIAVMPSSAADVLTLLDATQQRALHAQIPLITMSMGRLGMVSRMAGECFGSAVTFACAEKASAPGQVPAEALKAVLRLLRG